MFFFAFVIICKGSQEVSVCTLCGVKRWMDEDFLFSGEIQEEHVTRLGTPCCCQIHTIPNTFVFLLRVICQQQQRWLSSFVFQKIQAASGLGLWATKERHLPKHGPAIFLLLFFFVDYRIINEPHQKQRGEGSDNKEEEEFFFSGGFFKQTGEREREREKV